MNEWSEQLVAMNPALMPIHEAYEAAVRCLRSNYGFDYETGDAIVGELLLTRRFGKEHNHEQLRRMDFLTYAYSEFRTLYEVASEMTDDLVRRYLD